MNNNKLKILVLEDNLDTLNLIIEFFSGNGIEALGAESIKEAMDIFNENGSDIDLFLIDLKLPDGNGMDFLKTIRNLQTGGSHNKPAIILSCLITENVIKIGKELNVYEFMEKPFNLYELRENINYAVGNKQTNIF